jgi:hypothetical protein
VGKAGGSVGLRAHLDAKHRGCPADARVRVDYHGEDNHPSDFATGCPAHHHEPDLQAAVFEMIRWEDRYGGLEGVTGRPVATLPARLVNFYNDALDAQSRFGSWLERAREKAREK